jgi:hypothetical protein
VNQHIAQRSRSEKNTDFFRESNFLTLNYYGFFIKKLKNILAGLLIVLLCGCLSNHKKSSSIPELQLRIPSLAKAPKLDDKSGESWRRTACASGFIESSGVWAARQTAVYCAVSGNYFYFTFECRSKAGTDRKLKRNSRRIFGSAELVELFLQTNTGAYWHFAFNPAGSQYSARCTLDPKQPGYINVMTASVRN